MASNFFNNRVNTIVNYYTQKFTTSFKNVCKHTIIKLRVIDKIIQ